MILPHRVIKFINTVSFSALDTLTQVDGQIWHNKLMSGETVSLNPMKTAFENMQRMMDIGAIKQEDMSVPFNENIEAIANREVAIGGGEIDHIRTLNSSSKDTFCFMPHFSMTDGQGWLLNLGYFSERTKIFSSLETRRSFLLRWRL